MVATLLNYLKCAWRISDIVNYLYSKKPMECHRTCWTAWVVTNHVKTTKHFRTMKQSEQLCTMFIVSFHYISPHVLH